MNAEAGETIIRRFFVVTGGPGAGKTTLIEALAAAGFPVSAEVGRAVIKAEVARGGDALPWADRAAFAARMLAAEIAAYHAAPAGARPVIFDRGVPDVLGYCRLCGLDVPEALRQAVAACRYDPTVFIAPPWPEIFVQDDERRQDRVEATATHDMMRTVYTELGYRLVSLPRASVAARARFVQATIAASSQGKIASCT